MGSGLCQYVRWDAAGDATAPLTAFGLGATGGSAGDTVDASERTYAGGTALLHGVPRDLQGSVEFDPTILAPLALAQRATSGYPCSALPAFTLGLASDGILHRYNGCKVNSLSLSCEQGGVLQASIDWLALTKTEGTPGSPSDATGTPWEWWQCAVTLLGQTDRRVQSFSISLENNVTAQTDLDGGASSDARRFQKRLVEGSESVSVEVTTHLPLTAALRGIADDAILTNLAFTAVFTKGAAVLTLSLTNLAATGGGEVPIVGDDGEVEYSYSFRAAANANALSMTLA